MHSKIKLIASDLDGTLLHGGIRDCSDRAIKLISQLTSQGIIFAPASGRQYFNLHNLFSKVDGDLAYVCENGSLVIYKDQVIEKRIFEKDLSYELCQMVIDDPKCEVLISGERTSYVVPKSQAYVDHLRYFVKNHVTPIKKLDEICEPIMKVSYFTSPDYRDIATEKFKEKVAGRCQLMVSGTEWVDFAPHNTDKASALAAIGRHLGIAPDEMMAFGDNENDRAMLSFVGHPYLMKDCNPTMEDMQVARCACVEDVLQKMVDECEQ